MDEPPPYPPSRQPSPSPSSNSLVKAHADYLHNQDRDSPVADEAVPQLDPHWTYQPGDPGIRRLNHVITYILERMQKNTHIHVNYDKVREITQVADENPALF